MSTIDPITLEVVNNRLRYITKEMIVTLVRTAYSSVIYDGHDCSAALFDSKGQLLTLDAGLPFHIASMPFSVKAVLEKFRSHIHPGDIFMANDPSHGGSHLPDVLILMPIFHGAHLMFLAASRGHWTDVGGSVPGSLSGKAREIYQEGIVIPPIKIYEKGKRNQSLLDILLSNMRIREERAGDLMGQVASCMTAEKSCLELVEKYGEETIRRCGDEIISRTGESFRNKLANMPEGIYCFEDYLDNDGITSEARRIKVAVTIKSGDIQIDFEGTSPQSQGATNSPISTTYCASVIALKILVDPKGVPNEGFFRMIKINAPKGSLVHPRPHAATGGYTEVGYRIVYCIVGALSKALPKRVSGADYGTVNHSYISGVDPSTGKLFIHYEYPPGGNGATSVSDGASAIRSPASGDVSLQSQELTESLYPVIVKCLELRPDSGGAGRFRGGLGLVRKLEVLTDEAGLSVVADRAKIPPFGIFQGQSGNSQQWNIIRNGIEKPASPEGGKVMSLRLGKGDVVCCRSGGGGGYGNPLDRDPDRVRNDIIEGYVSSKMAKNIYGVVFDAKDGSVDFNATQNQRRSIRDKKRYFTVGAYGVPIFAEGIKAIILNEAEAGFQRGDLVEVVNSSCAVPYRAKVVLRSNVKLNHCLIDDETRQMMQINVRHIVEIRNISSQ
jgi:N-methylhydantoinase B